MRQQLNKFKSYGQLFEYIGNEFGNNKIDQELLKEVFEKAKLKKYIADKNLIINK